MPCSIWMRCAVADVSAPSPLEELPLTFASFAADIHRLVEGQHYISTRRLVDSREEHDLLEAMLEAAKPPAPKANSRGSLHYLLFTPFRYPPLRRGGRFHRAFEQSVFYGSDKRITAMAEIAYYRFVFMAHSEAKLGPMNVPYTHFLARVKSGKAVLLAAPPFAMHRAEISDPASYARSQPLGTRMREAGAEMFTAFSARWPEGENIGLFSPEALAANEPIIPRDSEWKVFVTANQVEFSHPDKGGASRAAHAFKRSDFEVNGVLPVLG